VSLRNVFQLRYLLLVALFVAVVVTGGVLTIEPPTSQRLLGTIPAVAGFVGIGVVTAAGLARRLVTPQVVLGLTVGIVAVLAGYNLRYYFVSYADGDYFSDFNTRIADRAAAYARDEVRPGLPIYWYGAPQIYVGHPTLRYGTLDLPVIDVLEDGTLEPEVPFLPGSAQFLVLPRREEDLRRIVSLCPGGTLNTVRDDRGRILFHAYLSPPERNCSRFVVPAPIRVPGG
jgi:hypothetical protein